MLKTRIFSLVTVAALVATAACAGEEAPVAEDPALAPVVVDPATAPVVDPAAAGTMDPAMGTTGAPMDTMGMGTTGTTGTMGTDTTPRPY